MSEDKKALHFISDTGRQMKDLMKNTLGTDEILWENEIRANIQVAQIMIISAVIMILSFILDLIGIYEIKLERMWIMTILNLLMLLVPAIICRAYKGQKRFLKLFMLICLVVAYSLTDLGLGYHVALLIAIPVVLSSRYYMRKLTAFIALISSISFGLSAAFGYRFGILDVNHIELPAGSILKIETTVEDAIRTFAPDTIDVYQSNILLHSFLPKYLLFLIIAIISAEIAYRGYSMVIKQKQVAKEHARIDTELYVASKIQERALPILHDRKDNSAFDLAASMEPAKEIGGDFYDFIMLDDTHLALVIADVSGKGVPAAMMMMVSKLLLDSSLQERKSPGTILAEVNHQLCEKNLEDMFVTVWLAIVDLTNGTLISANAGHEYPFLCRKGGQFEVIKDKHGLVIGAMDGMRYPETTLHLEPGDTLFVYTDGVTEANNEQQQLFGMDATQKALNKAGTANMNSMLEVLRKEINTFAGTAEQFDDITMMGFKLNHYINERGILVEPTRESIEEIHQYLENRMEEAGVSMKLMMKMNIAIDEIYSNIVYYSQAAWANVICDVTDDKVTITFRDNGIPYDPFKQPEPDITLSAEDREVGGLGIFMTRKLMNEVSYEYKDRVNTTTLMLHR